MFGYHLETNLSFMKNIIGISSLLVLSINLYSCGNKTPDTLIVKNASKENIESTLSVSDEKNKKLPMLDTIKCNISVIRKTDDNLNNLKESDIKLFLNTFSKDCLSNIEYTEYSNGMLYKVLEKYPSELISFLASFEDEEISHILSEFANPLLDINGPKINELIKKAQGDSNIKEKLLKAVDKAME